VTTTLTIGLANYGSTYPPGEWDRFADLGRAAEDAGVDRVVVVDHVVMGNNTDKYVWGKFPVPPEAPWFEPLTMLTAIAAVTTRVRLATGILIVPLRPAALLAKQVATLDQVSGGRVDLGVGTGWQREEYDAQGIDFAQRGQLLTDALGAMQALWRDTPAAFTSPTLSFEGIYCEPKPLQPGGVPIWVAGTLNARNLDRLVRYGAGWIPIMGETVDGIAAGAKQIQETWSAAGRDPVQLKVQAPMRMERDGDGKVDLARSVATVPDLLAAGATDVIATLRAFTGDLDAAPGVMQELVRRFQETI
jgi:probable F420-dependent oxidoreductase